MADYHVMASMKSPDYSEHFLSSKSSASTAYQTPVESSNGANQPP